MLRTPSLLRASSSLVRHSSHEAKKRFMQTIPAATKRSPAASFGNLNYQINTDINTTASARNTGSRSSRWAKHSLSFPLEEPKQPSKEESVKDIALPKPVARRSRKARFMSEQSKPETQQVEQPEQPQQQAAVQEIPVLELPKVATEQPAQPDKTTKKPRRKLRPRMALITLTPNAISHLRGLLDQPEPQLIRIGVRNRGCSGLTYHLEYVTEPGKFDEYVEQDGVKVFIDSKALFSIVGSEMDWIDDKLSSRFIFRNPNSKGTCGCGESFMV